MRVELNPRQTVLSSMPKGGVGAEIGVHLGDFSAQILRWANPKKFYLIDPYVYMEESKYNRSMYGGSRSSAKEMEKRYQSTRARFEAEISSGKIELLRMTSIDAAQIIKPDSLDFIYIDGDHSYDGAKSDFITYTPKLKVGGLLMGDDYSLGGWWGDGIVRALHESLVELPLKLDFLIGNQFAARRIA